MNENQQTQRNEIQVPNAFQQPEGGGMIWQPYAMGGGQWVQPQFVRLLDSDIERIADAVVRKLQLQAQKL